MVNPKAQPKSFLINSLFEKKVENPELQFRSLYSLRFHSQLLIFCVYIKLFESRLCFILLYSYVISSLQI